MEAGYPFRRKTWLIAPEVTADQGSCANVPTSCVPLVATCGIGSHDFDSEHQLLQPDPSQLDELEVVQLWKDLG